MKKVLIRLPALILMIGSIQGAQASDYTKYITLESGEYTSPSSVCTFVVVQSPDKSKLLVSVGGRRCAADMTASIPAVESNAENIYANSRFQPFQRFIVTSANTIFISGNNNNQEPEGGELFVKTNSCSKVQ
jgi:hypothetical protein